MKKAYLCLLLIAIVAATAGCSKLFAPTYPKETIPDSIRDICRKEYNIDERIDVKITGKTLGVRIHLDNLIDINLNLEEKSMEKIQHLFKTIKRICLSTDAELDFYVIIGYEKNIGVEVVFYSYVTDLQKAVAGWMSPEDYFERLIKTIRLGTKYWGDIRINKFIKDIESRNMVKVIVGNFSAETKLSRLSPVFLQILTDLTKKSYVKWQILQKRSVPVGAEKRLYYLEAVEYFTPNIEDIDRVSYKEGTVHKFYILVANEELNSVIETVFGRGDLPDEYLALGSPSTWNEDDFFVSDFEFHEFLANQIVQQIQSELSKKKEKELPVFSMEGDFIFEKEIDREIKLKDPSKNIFKVTFKPRKDKTDLIISREILDLAVKAIKEVCNKYKFYDLGEVQFHDHNGNSLLNIDKPAIFTRK